WLSLGTMAAIVAGAQDRALPWFATAPAPPSARVLALAAIDGNQRQGAYLSLVDDRSWAVWGTAGPVAVDQDSWTLMRWAARARGRSAPRRGRVGLPAAGTASAAGGGRAGSTAGRAVECGTPGAPRRVADLDGGTGRYRPHRDAAGTPPGLPDAAPRHAAVAR